MKISSKLPSANVITLSLIALPLFTVLAALFLAYLAPPVNLDFKQSIHITTDQKEAPSVGVGPAKKGRQDNSRAQRDRGR